MSSDAVLREGLVRLASEVPSTRAHILPLLERYAARRQRIAPDPTPQSGMQDYLHHLKKWLETPYPSIEGVLGVARSEVYVSVGIGELYIEVPKDGTTVTVKVTPDGKHRVYGVLRGGAKIDKVFPFVAVDPGYSRGTQGAISDYISDNLPTKLVYKVFGLGQPPKVFDGVDDMIRVYGKPSGYVTSPSVRKELKGQPIFKELAGPMGDGRSGDAFTIRYETQENFESHQDKSAAAALPRDFFLPSEIRNTPPTEPAEGTDLSIWVWQSKTTGKWFGIAFAAKQSKPLWHHMFKTQEQAKRLVDQTIQNRKAVMKYKQDRIDERKNFQHNLKEGDILYASWGYDQTNVDFYQVKEVIGKSVVIQGIQSKIVAERQQSNQVVPVPNAFHGQPMKKIPGGSGGSPSVKLTSYSSARLWDGKPLWETASGWGH